MEDGKPDETDTDGKKDNNSNEDISELDKLKAHNDAIEKELIRGRELKAEAQKLEAEKMVGGKSDAGNEETRTPEELKKTEAEDRVNRIGKAMGAEWANKKEE